MYSQEEIAGIYQRQYKMVYQSTGHLDLEPARIWAGLGAGGRSAGEIPVGAVPPLLPRLCH